MTAAIEQQPVGFLDEAPGVKSSARAAYMLIVAVTLLVALALTWILVRASYQKPVDRAGVEGLVMTGIAIMGALGTLAGWIQKHRTTVQAPADTTVTVSG